jgi:RING finger protein 113A
MFRKPKNANKASIRRNRNEDDHDDADLDDTSQLLQEARQSNAKKVKTSDEDKTKSAVMHQYQALEGSQQVSQKDLATRAAEHHPETKTTGEVAAKGTDGLFRDTTRNKFLAGPIKASTFVRTTARFDYQPDICKDYKETGFCGFGDTCIYLHDRGDTLTGWQLEQQWEEHKRKERAQKELEVFADGKEVASDEPVTTDDGIPFACHICREPFTDPIVTRCGHYFCQQCILDHVRENDNQCPVCHQDTYGVFNHSTKLVSKKRRLVGSNASWKEFADARHSKAET